MRSLVLNFTIDASLSDITIDIDREIPTDDVILRRVCVASPAVATSFQKLYGLQIDWLSSISNSNTEIVIPVSQNSSDSYICNEGYGVLNNTIPPKFSIKVKDLSDTSSSNNIVYVSLVFETDNYGTL